MLSIDTTGCGGFHVRPDWNEVVYAVLPRCLKEFVQFRAESFRSCVRDLIGIGVGLAVLNRGRFVQPAGHERIDVIEVPRCQLLVDCVRVCPRLLHQLAREVSHTKPPEEVGCFGQALALESLVDPLEKVSESHRLVLVERHLCPLSTIEFPYLSSNLSTLDFIYKDLIHDPLYWISELIKYQDSVVVSIQDLESLVPA